MAGIEPAIDRKLGADAVARVVRGEERRRCADIRRIARTLRGIDAEALIEHFARDARLVGERGVDAARMDGVDANAARPEFQRNRLAEAADAELRRAVRAEAVGGRNAVCRAHVDDRAAAGALDRGDDRLGADHRAEQVDLDDPAHFVFAEIVELLEDQDAGIVHKAVDLAEMRFGGGDHAVPFGARGDVQSFENGDVAQFGGQCAAFGFEHIGDDDTRAFLDEAADDALANAACAAGDDRHLVFKTPHPSLPLCAKA